MIEIIILLNALKCISCDALTLPFLQCRPKRLFFRKCNSLEISRVTLSASSLRFNIVPTSRIVGFHDTHRAVEILPKRVYGCPVL